MWRRLTRKHNKTNKEITQNERKQWREIILNGEYFNLGWFFELASSDKIYVTGWNLHEIKIEILLYYTSDFELNGSMVIGPVEHKKNY